MNFNDAKPMEQVKPQKLEVGDNLYQEGNWGVGHVTIEMVSENTVITDRGRVFNREGEGEGGDLFFEVHTSALNKWDDMNNPWYKTIPTEL